MLTVGEILKKERERRGLTYDLIEKETKIRKKFIQQIEDNNWQDFPSKTYILGVIKNYGRFLGLSEEKLIPFFRRQYEKQEELRFKKKVSRNYFIPRTKTVLKLTIFFILLIFGLYFGYQLKIYFTPPKVEIISPKITRFKKEEKIKLKGKTEKEAIVYINNQRVFLNDQGIFEFELPLLNPKNEAVIEVTGANGRKTIIKKIFEKEEIRK